MSETWYVVPAAFALRNAQGTTTREEEPMSWRLPEAWRHRTSGTTTGGISRLEPTRPPMARRSNT